MSPVSRKRRKNPGKEARKQLRALKRSDSAMTLTVLPQPAKPPPSLLRRAVLFLLELWRRVIIVFFSGSLRPKTSEGSREQLSSGPLSPRRALEIAAAAVKTENCHGEFVESDEPNLGRVQMCEACGFTVFGEPMKHPPMPTYFKKVIQKRLEAARRKEAPPAVVQADFPEGHGPECACSDCLAAVFSKTLGGEA